MKIIGTTEVGEGYRKEKAFVAIISLNVSTHAPVKARRSGINCPAWQLQVSTHAPVKARPVPPRWAKAIAKFQPTRL